MILISLFQLVGCLAPDDPRSVEFDRQTAPLDPNYWDASHSDYLGGGDRGNSTSSYPSRR